MSKVIYSYADKINHVYEVGKATKYGTFIGTVNCQPEDYDCENEWDGCRFAEVKCDIKALKEKIKWQNQRLEGMRQMLETAFENDCSYSVYKEMKNHYHSVKKQNELDIERYHNMKDNYEQSVEFVLNSRKEFQEKAKK